MLTMNEMLEEMANAPKASVQLYKSRYGDGWSCSVEADDGEGTKLEISRAANEPSAAIESCYEAYIRAIEKGVKQLSPKLLTAQANPPQPPVDDDIPF